MAIATQLAENKQQILTFDTNPNSNPNPTLGEGLSLAEEQMRSTFDTIRIEAAGSLHFTLTDMGGTPLLYSPVRFVFLRIPHLGPDSNPKPDPAP